MGDLKVKKLKQSDSKANYIHHLMNDVKALDRMLEEGLIEKSPIRIGAEQEFCLIDEQYRPYLGSKEVLEDINDDHFTTEIGKYNLEINLDPFELKDDCFSKLKNQLDEMLEKAGNSAAKYNSKVFLTGILPTLTLRNIGLDNMAEIPRYKALNDAIMNSRRDHFEIHIKGVDELNLLHDSVMLEGCNTSFQAHLQIDPDEFVEMYNWSQAISGPILSICTNSPILFGKELWSETRIALFTQSVDTRANSFLLNEKQPRVNFGKDWLKGSATNIFKDNISRFRSLITAADLEDSLEALDEGRIPKLKALNLHNGTVYSWNRACYGVGGGKPHLRIENRYLPSGPTASDEIANMMFWVGIMKGKPSKYDNIHEKMSFKDVKDNFFNAARYGMSTQFKWNDDYVPSHKLILDELLPMAYRGLYSCGISPKDAERYLTIIENRVRSQSGSQWIIQSYRNLKKNRRPYEAAQNLVAYIYEKQNHDYPVSTWQNIHPSTNSVVDGEKTVKHVMNTQIFSVGLRDSLELVENIMKWKGINHMPVIDDEKKLVGLISSSDLKNLDQSEEGMMKTVEEVMTRDLITIDEYAPLSKVKSLFEKHNINSLPVTTNDLLLGIVTSNDL